MKKGFTLIELLVAVLIIGILAVIALPQYRLAVEKARITRNLPLFHAIMDAQERLRLVKGSYSSNIEDLDIEFPYQTTTKIPGRISYASQELGGSLSLYDATPQVVFSLNRGYTIDYYGRHNSYFLGATAICYAHHETNEFAESVCKSLGRKMALTSSAGTPVYALDF